jgi:hypothetical protein
MVLPSEQFEMVEESASIGSLTLVAKRKVSLAGRDAFNRSNEQLRFIDFNAPNSAIQIMPIIASQ